METEGKYYSLELGALDYVAMYTCRLLPKFRKSVIIISPFLTQGWCQTLIQKLRYIPDLQNTRRGSILNPHKTRLIPNGGDMRFRI